MNSTLPSSSPAKGNRWLAQLAQSRTEDQLLRTCRRYLSSIRRADIERLPLACRPIPLEDATDLSAYALQLVRYHCEVDDASPLALRMAAFYAHANMRMAQILRQMNDAAEADTILARLGHGPPDERGREASPSPRDLGPSPESE